MKVKELFEKQEQIEYFRGFGEYRKILEKSIASEDVIIPTGLTREQRRAFIKQVAEKTRA